MFESSYSTGLTSSYGNINLRTDFEFLEVNVSLILLGTVGFSARRDGR